MQPAQIAIIGTGFVGIVLDFFLLFFVFADAGDAATLVQQILILAIVVCLIDEALHLCIHICTQRLVIVILYVLFEVAFQ